MSITPMTPSTLPLLIAVVAAVSLLRSFVSMSLEAMIPAVTGPEDQARVSAWFNVGNLGGTGLGGGLGLTLLTELEEPWMAGAILAVAILFCTCGLLAIPAIPSHRAPGGPIAATRGVFGDIWRLAKTKGGLLVTVLCFVPMGTGAAQSVLAQAEVAAQWNADADTVAWVAMPQADPTVAPPPPRHVHHRARRGRRHLAVCDRRAHEPPAAARLGDRRLRRPLDRAPLRMPGARHAIPSRQDLATDGTQDQGASGPPARGSVKLVERHQPPTCSGEPAT